MPVIALYAPEGGVPKSQVSENVLYVERQLYVTYAPAAAPLEVRTEGAVTVARYELYSPYAPYAPGADGPGGSPAGQGADPNRYVAYRAAEDGSGAPLAGPAPAVDDSELDDDMPDLGDARPVEPGRPRAPSAPFVRPRTLRRQSTVLYTNKKDMYAVHNVEAEGANAFAPLASVFFKNRNARLNYPDYAALNSRVRYLDDDDRKAYEVEVKPDGLLFLGGQPLHTEGARSPVYDTVTHRFIYAMSGSGRIYAANMMAEYAKCGFYQPGFGKGTPGATTGLQGAPPKNIIGFHHSSFLEGRPVAAAGDMIVNQGKLMALTNDSGHYKPNPQQLWQVLAELRRRCVQSLHRGRRALGASACVAGAASAVLRASWRPRRVVRRASNSFRFSGETLLTMFAMSRSTAASSLSRFARGSYATGAAGMTSASASASRSSRSSPADHPAGRLSPRRRRSPRDRVSPPDAPWSGGARRADEWDLSKGS